MTKLLKRIESANEVEIDAMWAFLKYREFGILRKLKCFALVLGLDFEKDIMPEVLKDEEGRILDKDTRHAIHDTLKPVSQR